MPDTLLKYNPAFLSDEDLIDSFVIRKREFEAVMEVVRENTGPTMQHVLIVGPRGSGKTTLVLRVAAEVRRDADLCKIWYPVTYGEESYSVTNAGEFWLEALFHIGEQTGEARWKETYEELSGEMDPDRLARRALIQLLDFADERQRKLLLIVENLNMLVGDQFSGNEAWTFREMLRNEPRLMLLGTATKRFDEIEDEDEALYEFFRLIDLEPVDSPEDLGALWTLASGEKAPLGYLRAIEILTGGNPRLLRILSEFAARTSFKELTDNLVRLVDDHTDFLKSHFDALAAQERKVFAALAERWDPGTAQDISAMTRLPVNKVSAQLKRLEERGFIHVDKKLGRTNYYEVTERLYNIYYLMRRRGQASVRVRAAVRFMVHLYRGDDLIPVMRSMVDEAGTLAPDLRHSHYIGFREVLSLTEPALRSQIIEATRDQMTALPDVPADLYAEYAPTEGNPYADLTADELLATDVATLSDVDDAKHLLSALVDIALNGAMDGFARALEVADHILSQTSDDAEIYRNQGIALSRLGHFDDALDAHDRAIELHPDDARAHYNRGVALGNLGRFDDALDAYDRAIELRPDDARAHTNRGAALGNLGRFDDALDAYDRAIELRPNYARTHTNRGVALVHLGHSDDALDAHDRAIELRPDDALAHYNRGVALGNLGRFDDALDALDRAIELRPDDARAHTNRARTLANLGQYDDAIDALAAALDLTTALDLLAQIVTVSSEIAAGGYGQLLLDKLLGTPLVEQIEPLIVALRMDLGEEIEVAQEIEEVARDIVKQIEAKRALKTAEGA
ncbi:MAG: tetratricopeptide repeat protein [Bacteroidota bacterium]